MKETLDWMSKVKNMAALVTAVIGTAMAWVGVSSYLDGRYALASEVKAEVQQIQNRLTLAELKQLYRTAQEEVFFYRDQLRKYPKDEEIKAKLKEAEETVADLKKQIKELESKSKE